MANRNTTKMNIDAKKANTDKKKGNANKNSFSQDGSTNIRKERKEQHKYKYRSKESK